MLKKVLAGLALFLLLLLAALVIVPLTFKAQINNWVKSQISNGFNAKVNYTNVSITWFKNFPNINVSLQQLFVTGDSLFTNDTLAAINNLELTLDIHSLLSGSQYKIIQCNMDRPRFNFRADTTGQANWHVLKQVSVIPGQGVVTAADSNNLTLQIDHYKVNNATIHYTNAQQKLDLQASGLNMDGQVQNSVIQSNVQLASFSVKREGSPYIQQLQLNSHIRFSLAGDSLMLDTLSATMGRNDMHGAAQFNHVLASQSGAAVFTGKLNLQSQYFDLTNWLQSSIKPVPKTAVVANSSHSKQIPVAAPTYNTPTATDSINISLSLSFDSLILNKLVLRQVKAGIGILKDSVTISNFGCNLLGGSATANVKLLHRHNVQLQLNLKHCDIEQTANTVPVTDKIAPVAQYIHGSFSAELKAKGRLNDAMNLDYNTLDGDGRIQISKATITQIPVLADVGKLAKNANLSNLEMPPLTSVIHCKNSQVTVEPTDIKFTNGLALNVKGTNTFVGDINYNMMLSVPTKQMGGIANLAQSFLSGIGGLNIKVPDLMTFSFNVTGTFTKPQAKLMNMGTANIGQ